jgi:hypothetical protein
MSVRYSVDLATPTPIDGYRRRMADDLAALQARLEGVLDPYRDRLEAYDLYGAPYLRRPGAKAHDWFAGVSEGRGVVRYFLLPMHGHPELLDGVSHELRKRKTGASLFSFTTLDDAGLTELEALVARAFATYMESPKG